MQNLPILDGKNWIKINTLAERGGRGASTRHTPLPPADAPHYRVLLQQIPLQEPISIFQK